MAQAKQNNDGLVRIGLRNQFYSDGSHKTSIALLLSIITNIIVASLLIYIITHPPAPKYFPTGPGGRIVPLQPLSEPNHPESFVKQWAASAAVATYNYNFVNWQSELQSASGFFTGKGWQDLQSSLLDSQLIERVRQQRLIISSEPSGAPQIVRSGLDSNGVYAWNMNVPIVVRFTSSQQNYQDMNYVVNMKILRVSTLNSPDGIGIDQFRVGPAGSGENNSG